MGSVQVAICDDADALPERKSPTLSGSPDVVIFPELVDGGYAALYKRKQPHQLSDAVVTRFRDLSKTLSCTIIAGSIHLSRASNAATNTSLVFARGRLVYRYDKIHLFRPVRDHRFFAPGTESGVFKLATRAGAVKAGIAICYDLRFPELMRSMALRGMRILFVPARWPAIRTDAWYTLLKARALENQIFVVGCNASDLEGGDSFAFNPLGQQIFSSTKLRRPYVRTVSIKLEELAKARAHHDNLRDARFLRAGVRI